MAEQTVTLRLQADNGQFVGTLRTSKTALDGLTGSTSKNRAEIAAHGSAAEAASRQNMQHSRALTQVKTALVGLIGIQSARWITSQADLYTNLNARLHLVTNSQSEFAAAQEETFAIAQRTSAPLESTVTLYSRIAQALADVGGTQQEVAGLTETINKAFAVSGASVQEMDGAIRQLSQAFASGVLRGEEYNSVNEQAPRIMKALADSLGVTRGELKALAEDGELTADKLRKALSGEQADRIAAEFENIPVTIGRAFQQLSNEVVRFIGEADTAAGASAGIAQAIVGVSSVIGPLTVGVAALATVMGTNYGAALLATSLAKRRLLIDTAAETAAAARSAQVAEAGALAAMNKARALGMLGGSLIAATNAENAYAAAQARSAQATAAAGAAAAAKAAGVGRLGAGLLALVGGPIGLAVAGTAALAIGLKELAESERAPIAAIEDLNESMRTQLDLQSEIAAGRATNQAEAVQVKQIDALVQRIEELNGKLRNQKSLMDLTNTSLTSGLHVAFGLAVEMVENQLGDANTALAEHLRLLILSGKEVPPAYAAQAEAARKYGEAAAAAVVAVMQLAGAGRTAAYDPEPLLGQIQTSGGLGEDVLKQVEQLEAQARALSMNSIELLEYQRTQALASAATEDETRELNQAYDALIRNTRAVKAQADAADQLAKRQREVQEAMEDVANESARLKALASSLYEVDQWTALNIELESAILQFGEASDEVTLLREAMDYLANKTIGEDTKQAIADYNAWITEATENLDAWLEANERSKQEAGQQFADFAWDRVAQSAGDFGAAFAQGEGAAEAFGRAGMDAFLGIADASRRAGVPMSEMFTNFESFSQNVLPAIGEFFTAYAAASGGGTEGAIAGAIGGALSGAGGGWVGMVVGAILGAYSGSQGTSEKHPEVRVDGGGGSGAQFMPGAMSSRNGAFGNIVVGSREFSQWGFEGQWADALADFDNSVARFLSDTQIEAVTEALRTFSYHGMDALASLEEITEARFAVITRAVFAGTEAPIAAFILGISSKFEDQFVAFADIMQFQDLEESGKLLSGTLLQTIILLDEFRVAGESLGEAYQRLSEAATAYGDVVAGAQDELLTADLSDFQSSYLQIQRLELQRIEAMEAAARAAGDLAPRLEDVAVAGQAADAAIARLVQELRESSLDIAADLYGRDLADIDAEIQAIRDAEDAVTSSTLNATAALRSFGEEMQTAREIAAATLRFGNLDGDELANFALEALGRGEISLDQALQAGQDVYKSGDDFNTFFDQAVAAFRRAPRDQGGGFDGQVQAERRISQEEQDLLDERDRIEAENERRRRLSLATDLAQNVADIAGAEAALTGAPVDFNQVMADLGFSGAQLAADLGIDADALPAFLTGLQNTAVFDGSMASMLETLPEDIARALFDLMRDGLPETLPEGTRGPGGTPGTPGVGEGPPGVVIPGIEKSAEIATNTSNMVVEIREVKALLARVLRESGRTAEAAEGTHQELRGVSRTAMSEALRLEGTALRGRG